MPALKEEYDYYEYASKRRQGTVKSAVPYSAVHKKGSSVGNDVNKISTSHTSAARTTTVSKKVTSQSRKTVSNASIKTKSQSKNLNLKTTTTRDVTKNATRAATRDDSFIGTKKKTTTTSARKKQSSKNISIDPVVFNNKKTLKKPQEMTLNRPVSNVKSKSVAKQKARVKEMFRNVVVDSLVFGMMFLICYRYSSINEAFNELNDLKNELRNKQTINAQIESNIKQNTDLAYIENYAKYQLGMQKPKDSQIQKVSVQKQDKILLPIEIEEEEEKSIFNNLVDSVLSVLE